MHGSLKHEGDGRAVFDRAARSLLIGCVSGAALLAGASAARCATTAADSNPGASSVAEVVVTAEKRAENVQKVPISINVVEQAQLEKFNIHDFQTLQNSIPGLIIHTSPVSTGIYLRGFGSAGSNPAFDASVSVYQDGVYFGLARQEMAPFFDVERIEVLRGPQGALVGKNTAAGAISITTADPTKDFEGAATLAYDFDPGGVEGYGYISGPLSETLSARLAVHAENLDGWVQNLATNSTEPRKKDAFARLTLRFEPTARFKLTTKIEYGQFATNGTPAVLVSATTPQTPPLTKSATDGLEVPPLKGEHSLQTGYNSATKADLLIGDFTLRSITGFSGFAHSTKTFAAPLNPDRFDILWAENFDQQSEELQLLSPTAHSLDFIVGAYADHSHHSFLASERYDIFGGLFNGQQHSIFHQSEDSASVFADATWRITPALRLLGSVRYTWIRKQGSFQLFDDFELGPIGPLLGAPHSVQQTISENHIDPSVTAQYDLTGDVMVYVTYAEGSKGGGFDPSNNAVTSVDFAFKPEHSTDYEVGVKSSFFSRRLILDVSGFIEQFRDLQVSAYDPATVSLATTNAASATSKGVEATVAWQATDHLRFSGDGAYTHAIYDNFPGAKCTFSQPSPPCNPATNNIKGLVLQFVPTWSGDLQADYSTPLTQALTLGATVTVKYRSSVWVDDENYNPIYGLQGPTTKLDARIQVGAANTKWDVALVGRNLTNTIARSYAYAWPLETAPGGVPAAVAILDEGRSVAIEASVHF
jgi:iron complex outermembrane receptor protein